MYWLQSRRFQTDLCHNSSVVVIIQLIQNFGEISFVELSFKHFLLYCKVGIRLINTNYDTTFAIIVVNKNNSFYIKSISRTYLSFQPPTPTQQHKRA